MKHQLFTLFAILSILTVGMAAAQEAEVPAPEAQAEAQNPAVDLDVEGTMSVSGKVVNASPEEIILETEDGREVFLLDSEDLYPEPILDGSEATVWFVERADRLYATRLEVSGGDLGSEAEAVLPQTSGIQPLLALLGMAAVVGAATVRRRRQN